MQSVNYESVRAFFHVSNMRGTNRILNIPNCMKMLSKIFLCNGFDWLLCLCVCVYVLLATIGYLCTVNM